MNARLVNRVIFPLHERLKGKPTHAALREAERTQWLSRDELRELQLRRLRELLAFAHREVPYYTRLLDEHGLRPERVESLDDLGRLPFLTKDVIRAHAADLTPRSWVGRVQVMTSGGSTGATVSVPVDMPRLAVSDAFRLRAHRWFGADVGRRELALWGSHIEATKQDTLRGLRDRLLNSRLITVFELGEDALARHAAFLSRYRPEKIFAYSSAIALLSRYLAAQGWRPDPGWPRAIFVTAEPLDDADRVVVESVFGCPVSVEYGAREVGCVANECPVGGLHVNAEGMLVEVLPAGPAVDGEAGELVITNLHSRALPIIRYRIEDVASGLDESPCACGRALPRLGRVEGRRSDFLVAADGRVIHGRVVSHLFREDEAIWRAVREFQVVQERLDLVRVSIVPAPGFTAAVREAIERGFRRLLGGGAAVEVQALDSIPRPPSGKRRVVVSHVADERFRALVGAVGDPR